ncbi:hypothetical protein M5K25_018719 [Dendrobium thyrsiflorum]|uniref:Uncharacterized protein n=1 Tax=Dendrobium thyrsiflorum TaxID=117978 RepID=A0ABD0UQP8_DENTH
MDEMMRKMLEVQTKTTLSEARGPIGDQGCGENPNPIRRRKDQEVEILERDERMPPRVHIPREKSSRESGERREGVQHERMGAKFEMRMDDYMGAEFERE